MRMREAAAIGVLLMVCGGVLRADASASNVLVRVNGHAITAADLDGDVRARIRTLEEQIYATQRQAIDQFIFDELIRQEAAKQHVTPEAFVKKVEAGASVADDELRSAMLTATVQGHGSVPPAAVQAQVRQQLLNRARNERLHEVVEKLRDAAKIDLLLPELPPERAHVDLSSSDYSLGPAGAPVTVVEFADFQCPYCARMDPIVHSIVNEYKGKVRWVFKNFPLPIHQFAVQAAVAATCAGEQGRYWPYHDRLFGTELNAGSWLKTASELGLNTARFTTCMQGKEAASLVEADVRQGRRIGLTGTPTFVVNGVLVRGSRPPDVFRQVIDDALNQLHSAK